MSAIFEENEREYCDLSAAIARRTAAIPALDGEEKKARVVEVETDLAEADALIRRMELEARSLPPANKTPLLGKVKDYKNDVNKLRRELKAAGAASTSHEAQRADLLARAELGSSGAPTSGSQRERLLQSTDRVRATGDRIREGQRTMLETEELGVSILQDLHKQRQTIVNARDTLHDADDSIGRSRRLLNVMSRRAMMNKAILVGVIIMLLGSIGVVIYFQFGGGKNKD